MVLNWQVSRWPARVVARARSLALRAREASTRDGFDHDPHLLGLGIERDARDLPGELNAEDRRVEFVVAHPRRVPPPRPSSAPAIGRRATLGLGSPHGPPRPSGCTRYQTRDPEARVFLGKTSGQYKDARGVVDGCSRILRPTSQTLAKGTFMRASAIAVSLTALSGLYLAGSLASGRQTTRSASESATAAATSAGQSGVAVSETVTFPDGSVGNVIFSWHPTNNTLDVIQTIPDSVGRGMKTQMSQWIFANFSGPPDFSTTVAFTNP